MSTITPPPAGTYRIDSDRSTIRFRTRHMFGLGAVTGTFALSSGKVVVTAPATRSSVTAAATSASFASGNPTRDKKVRSGTYLDAANHPEIDFRSTGVRITGEGWVVEGLLSVRDRQAPAEITVTEATVEGTTLTVRATARIDRYAHEVTAMKGITGRHVNLEITAVADRM